jgi:hypothetical protein
MVSPGFAASAVARSISLPSTIPIIQVDPICSVLGGSWFNRATKLELMVFHQQARSVSTNGAVAEQESDDDTVSMSNWAECYGSGGCPAAC